LSPQFCRPGSADSMRGRARAAEHPGTDSTTGNTCHATVHADRPEPAATPHALHASLFHGRSVLRLAAARQVRQDRLLLGHNLAQLVLALAVELIRVARLDLLHVEPVKLAAL
jgi:hypothetical protein